MAGSEESEAKNARMTTSFSFLSLRGHGCGLCHGPFGDGRGPVQRQFAAEPGVRIYPEGMTPTARRCLKAYRGTGKIEYMRLPLTANALLSIWA
jgi:hypothetical protein